MTFFKNIKSAFRKLVSSTPVKMLKTADVGVIGGYFTQTDHPFLLQIDHPKQTTI